MKLEDGFFEGFYVSLKKNPKSVNQSNPYRLGFLLSINLKRKSHFSLKNHSKLIVCDLVQYLSDGGVFRGVAR